MRIPESWVTSFVSAIQKRVPDPYPWSLITRILNGGIGFGDGVDYDNIKGQWVTVTTAGAGSEVAVSHNLGTIPVGFLLMIPPQSGVVNRGSSAWTTTQVFLTCSAATQTFTIFLLPDSSGSR